MEYLDFSSVITTIRNYISDAHSMNQIDMMYQLFVSFLSSDESLDFDFDNGLVCRWFNGSTFLCISAASWFRLWLSI